MFRKLVQSLANLDIYGWVIIILIILVLFSVGAMIVTAGQGCEYSGEGISDITVPYPNTAHCTGNGKISVVCGTTIQVTAYKKGWFSLTSEDLDASAIDASYSDFEWFMNANDTRQFNLHESHDIARLWHDNGFIGLVDIRPDRCYGKLIRRIEDGRINQGWAEDVAIVYGFDGYVQVYSPDGLILLQADEDSELPMCNGDICIYYLSATDEYQINIISENKLIEIISPSIDFTHDVYFKEWEL